MKFSSTSTGSTNVNAHWYFYVLDSPASLQLFRKKVGLFLDWGSYGVGSLIRVTVGVGQWAEFLPASASAMFTKVQRILSSEFQASGEPASPSRFAFYYIGELDWALIPPLPGQHLNVVLWVEPVSTVFPSGQTTCTGFVGELLFFDELLDIQLAQTTSFSSQWFHIFPELGTSSNPFYIRSYPAIQNGTWEIVHFPFDGYTGNTATRSMTALSSWRNKINYLLPITAGEGWSWPI
jgi:hypothetical protein